MKSAISVLGLATLVPAIQLVAIGQEASPLAASAMMNTTQNSGEMTEAEIQQAVADDHANVAAEAQAASAEAEENVTTTQAAAEQAVLDAQAATD
jgi:cell division protein FtsI/penicillin-binding protein 2